jgi:glycosyltransferase involved in cell wall biosynthesis
MRVTHIITRLVIGGAQENTVATVLGLRERPGLKVDLISGPTTGPEGSMEPALGERMSVLTRVPSLVRPVHPWKDLRALGRLTALLREMGSDIVHTHSGKAGILGRLAARRAGIPVIIHHIHGPSFGPFQGAAANTFFRAAERYAGQATTHFICSAQAMARRYLQAGIGHPEMYTRIFSGFKIEPFLEAKNDPALRHKLGLASDAFVIGKIGRIAPLKGHEDLLVAFAEVLKTEPRSRLLFVGDGPLRSQIEGIALAAAKPVVAYDFDGADEVCLDGQTGFLVRTGEVQSVALHLLTLAKSPELRTTLGLRGRQLVEKEFRVENMIEKIYDLYQRLARTAGLAP